MDITIYTDGACINNPGKGGWGAVLICGQNRKELSGGCRHTTNIRMELTAVREALRALRKNGSNVTLYSDCQAVVSPFTNGRAAARLAKGTQENADLWKDILELAASHTVRMEWVKGHDGNSENERCDRLATSAAMTATDPDTVYEESVRESQPPQCTQETTAPEDKDCSPFDLLCREIGVETACRAIAVLSRQGFIIKKKD